MFLLLLILANSPRSVIIDGNPAIEWDADPIYTDSFRLCIDQPPIRTGLMADTSACIDKGIPADQTPLQGRFISYRATLTSLSPGKHTITVLAVNSLGSSPESNRVSIDMPPATPGKLIIR